MSKKISWFTELYAPRHYPANLINGDCFWFFHENQTSGFSFSGRPSGGWRETGVMTSAGSSEYPMPVPLGAKLTWLSITEKKYYQAIFKIPQARILAEFAKTFDFESLKPKRKSQIQHTMLQFAFAPGGFVSLRAGGTRTIELANYQAQRTDLSWEYFARRGRFSPEVLSEQQYLNGYYLNLPDDIKKQVDNNTLPLTRWRDYSTQFQWQFTTDLELFGCRICCVNGNNEFFNQKSIGPSKTVSQQYAPAWIRMYYKENGKKMQTTIRFTKQKPGVGEQPTDDVEIFEFFKKHLHTHKRYTVIVKKIQNTHQAFLMNGIEMIKIPIHEISTFHIADNNHTWF